PGTDTTLTLLRDGREQQLKVTLGELNTPAPADRDEGDGGSGEQSEGGKLGIEVTPLTPEVASRFQLPSDRQGLIVTGVDPSGPSADAGLQQGDLIEQANQRPVKSIED